MNDETYEKLKAHWPNAPYKFDRADTQTLVSFVKENPCHLPSTLLMIECAHYLQSLFPKHWTDYYADALVTAENCWDSIQISQVYYLGRILYYYDQDREQSKIAIEQAYKYNPENVRVVSAYIDDFWNDLTLPERESLTKRLSEIEPRNAFAYYAQGSSYASLAKEAINSTQRTTYLNAAIAAYKKSLDLGLNREQHLLPPIAAISQIERLEKLL
jgi:tetratricopeptide (TPR) repeat protein